MGAVLLTNEFPAAGISVFAELRYRNSVAGAIHEYDPDLIFSGSDAERGCEKRIVPKKRKTKSL